MRTATGVPHPGVPVICSRRRPNGDMEPRLAAVKEALDGLIDTTAALVVAAAGSGLQPAEVLG